MLNMIICKCLQKYHSKRKELKNMLDKKHFFIDFFCDDYKRQHT
jgi:hypothetical protein